MRNACDFDGTLIKLKHKSAMSGQGNQKAIAKKTSDAISRDAEALDNTFQYGYGDLQQDGRVGNYGDLPTDSTGKTTDRPSFQMVRFPLDERDNIVRLKSMYKTGMGAPLGEAWATDDDFRWMAKKEKEASYDSFMQW